MEYFELYQSKKVENSIEILGLERNKYSYSMTAEDFKQLDKLRVAYFSGREFEERCDVVIQPTFLISDTLKKILELYDREMEFKGVQVFPTTKKSKIYPLYWVPKAREIEGFHKDTVIRDNGMLEKLILDERKIKGYPVFRLSGLVEYKMIVSLPVAESILRRRLYGVELKRVEVK